MARLCEKCKTAHLPHERDVCALAQIAAGMTAFREGLERIANAAEALAERFEK